MVGLLGGEKCGGVLHGGKGWWDYGYSGCRDGDVSIYRWPLELRGEICVCQDHCAGDVCDWWRVMGLECDGEFCLVSWKDLVKY